MYTARYRNGGMGSGRTVGRPGRVLAEAGATGAVGAADAAGTIDIVGKAAVAVAALSFDIGAAGVKPKASNDSMGGPGWAVAGLTVAGWAVAA